MRVLEALSSCMTPLAPDHTHNSLLSEVYANGGYELGLELAVGVLVKEGCFTHSGVAQSKKLNQIVILGILVHRAGSLFLSSGPFETRDQTRKVDLNYLS